MTWTPMQDAIVRRYYGRLSATQIAIQIGCTKGAVIGRASRMGLGVHDVDRRRLQSLAQSLRPERPKKETRGTMDQYVEQPLPTRVEQGVGLMDLQRHHCRSLLGYDHEGLPVYCGLTRHDDTGSYCPQHYRMYHQRAPVRFYIAR